MDVRVVLWTCLVMTAVMICTHTLFLPILFSILVMGIIPGTSLRIPTAFMLIVYPVLFIIGLYWLSTVQILLGDSTVHTRTAKEPVRRRTPTGSLNNKSSTPVKRRARATA